MHKLEAPATGCNRFRSAWKNAADVRDGDHPDANEEDSTPKKKANKKKAGKGKGKGNENAKDLPALLTFMRENGASESLKDLDLNAPTEELLVAIAKQSPKIRYMCFLYAHVVLILGKSLHNDCCNRI